MITLWGFRYSVYVRIVRMALAERGQSYEWNEVNPFDRPTDPTDSGVPHPFGRVPVLDHNATRLYEATAITTYLDTAFLGNSWRPMGPLAQARVAQIINIIDSYGYRPMVRQVFDTAVFGPATGREVDPTQLTQGLKASEPVLAALENIAKEGLILNGSLTRADLHLAPMLGYFTAAPQGAAMLADHTHLSNWFETVKRRNSYIQTEPGLPPS